jgi:hypothetical protein
MGVIRVGGIYRPSPLPFLCGGRLSQGDERNEAPDALFHLVLSSLYDLPGLFPSLPFSSRLFTTCFINSTIFFFLNKPIQVYMVEWPERWLFGVRLHALLLFYLFPIIGKTFSNIITLV